MVGIYLVAARGRSTLVLVHRQPLLDQWVAQLGMFLGLDSKAIGQIGAGKRKPTGRLDVAMLQSLVREGRVDDIVAGYGHVIVDECHHVPAVSFERVLSEVKARYLTGLTATPRRRDGLHPILEMQLGLVRFAVDAKSQAARRPFEHRLIVRDTTFVGGALDPAEGIQTLYAALAGDEHRNRLILSVGRFSGSPRAQRSHAFGWKVVATGLPFGDICSGASGLTDTENAAECCVTLAGQGRNTSFDPLHAALSQNPEIMGASARCCGGSNGIRTRVSALRGLCPAQ